MVQRVSIGTSNDHLELAWVISLEMVDASFSEPEQISNIRRVVESSEKSEVSEQRNKGTSEESQSITALRNP